ncbi:MAG: DNA-binding protein [Candidatus Cloacimonadales bacterium]|nr:DNA-binding protein [Candidatus Cloacimonadales bacterium]
MKCKKMGTVYFVRIDRGEEVVSELKKVCEKHNIKLGKISAIGAVNKATIGFFDVAEKQYHSTILTGDHEITTLLGNITTMDGEIYLHCHITLAGEDQKVIGGHLNEAVVSATCEAIIEEFSGEVNRFRDETLGLNLLDV